MYYYYYHPQCCFYVNPCYPTFTPYPYQQHLSLPYTSYPHSPGGYNPNYDNYPIKCCYYRKKNEAVWSWQKCAHKDLPCPPPEDKDKWVNAGEGVVTYQTCDANCSNTYQNPYDTPFPSEIPFPTK